MTNECKAGVAKRAITPEVGAGLSGFIARLKPSDGILDEIHVRALVVQSATTVVGIVQADLLGFAPWQVREVRDFAHRKLGIAPDCLLLSATHTHSGPGVVYVRGCEMAPLEYQTYVLDQIKAALQEAATTAQTATLRLASVPYQLGLNRREETENGVVLGVSPDKPHPTSLEVAVLETATQKAILYTHACHPYTLGGESLLISGDFPSIASLQLENENATVALFLNGCAGNIAPEAAFQGEEATIAEGVRLAEAVTEACTRAEPAECLPLLGKSVVARLPFSPFPTIEEVEEVAAAQERVVRPEERGQSAVQERIAEALGEWSGLVKKAVQRRFPIDPVQCEVQLLQLGDLTLLGIAGEPFYETGEAIRASAPHSRFWPLGYTNAYCGYIPTSAEFPMGGYEVNDAYKYVGLWQADQSAEALVLAAGKELLEKDAPQGGINPE